MKLIALSLVGMAFAGSVSAQQCITHHRYHATRAVVRHYTPRHYYAPPPVYRAVAAPDCGCQSYVQSDYGYADPVYTHSPDVIESRSVYYDAPPPPPPPAPIPYWARPKY